VAELPADDLQRRMACIRENLHRGAEELAHDVRKLADWRYHVRRHPWASLALSAAVGYLVVPRRKQHPNREQDMESLAELARQHRLELQPRVKQPGLAGTLVSLLGSALLRAGMSYAAQHFGRILESRSAPGAPSHNGDEETFATRKPR
jgi:hypothetical protein